MEVSLLTAERMGRWLVTALRARTLAFGALVTIGAILPLLLLLVFGPPPSTRYAADDLLLFDLAWRAAHGIFPSSSFYCPLGFVYVGYFALFVKIVGPSAYAFSLAQNVLNASLCAIFWIVIRRRFVGSSLVLVASLGALFVATPWQYMLCPSCLGFGAYYDKVSSMLLSVLIVIFSHSSIYAKKSLLGSVFVGAVFSALLFSIKISYFGAAVFVIFCMTTLLVFLRGSSPFSFKDFPARCKSLLLLAIFFVWVLFTLVLAFSAVTHVQLLEYVSDLSRAARARGVNPLGILIDGLLALTRDRGEFYTAIYLGSGVAFAAAIAMPAKLNQRAIIIASAAATGIFSVCLVTLFNSQHADLFLVTIVALCTLSWASPQSLVHEAMQHASRFQKAALVVFSSILIGPPAALVASSGGISDLTYALSAMQPTADYPFDAGPLVRWRVWHLRESEREYLEDVARLTATLEKKRLAGSRIMTMDYVNPFPIILGSAPIKGGGAWWQAGITFQPSEPLDLYDIAGDACVLVDPSDPVDFGTRDALRMKLRTVLTNEFDLVSQDSSGRIYRKRSGCS